MHPLTPGACTAPLLRITPSERARLQAMAPSAAYGHLPPGSRAALAAPEVLVGASGGAHRIFIALVDGLSASLAVLLASRGCGGALLQPEAPLAAHAQSVFMGLGLPLARLAAPMQAVSGEAFTLELPASGAGGALRAAQAAVAALPGGALPVLPLAMASGAAPDRPLWLELVTGQAEERALAAAWLASHPQPGGIGLLRLEALAFADPGLDPETLSDLLAAIFEDLRPWPLLLRLFDFTPDKPPPPGAHALLTSPRLQLDAVHAALRRAPHPRLALVLPHATTPPREPSTHLTRLPMFESPHAPAHAWPRQPLALIGLRDLTEHPDADADPQVALQRLIARVAADVILVASPWRLGCHPGGG